MKHLSAALILLLCMGTNLALGQDTRFKDEDLLKMSLDDLLELDVEVASKSKESVTDAPGIIQIITAAEIEKFGARNLMDLLDRATGSYVMSNTVSPQSGTTFRGSNSQSFDGGILFLIDGRPHRESFTGGINMPIYNSFPVNIIERLEIVRGPGSVLYGSNAYYGVVNIITKKENNTSGSFSSLAGSFGALGAQGDYSFVNDDFRIMGAFNWFEEDGWDFELTDAAQITDTAKFYNDNSSFFLNSTYKNFDLSLYYSGVQTSFFSIGQPIWTTPPPLPQFDDPAKKKYDIDRIFGDLGYSVDIGQKLNSSLNVTYNYLMLGINELDPVPNDENTSNDFIFELSNQYRVNDKFKFLFGGTVYLQDGGLSVLGIQSYSKTWSSVYFQADYQLIEPVKVIVGGQYNNIGSDQDFVPRVGLITNFTNNLGLKVLWAQAYRAPFAVETDTNIPFIIVGSSTLNSEKLTNFDAQLFFKGSKFESYLTYYNYSSADEIGIVRLFPESGDLTLTYANLPNNLKGSGLELEGKYIPNGNFFFTGSFLSRGNETEINGENYEEATSIPNTFIKVGGSYQTNSRAVTVGVFNTYLSDFNLGLAGQTNPITAVNPDPSAFNQLSANLRVSTARLFDKEFGPFSDVELNVYGTNLLDEDIYFGATTITSIPGRPGRALYGSVIVKF